LEENGAEKAQAMEMKRIKAIVAKPSSIVFHSPSFELLAGASANPCSSQFRCMHVKSEWFRERLNELWKVYSLR